MQQPSDSTSESKGKRLSGMVISGLATLFLLMDVGMKFARPAIVTETTVKLGYQERAITPLAVVLLACTLLYAVPRTAVLGAILLTGYLGGAVATHVRVGDPLFSHALFPVYLGIMVWLGLYLRSRVLRSLLPLRS